MASSNSIVADTDSVMTNSIASDSAISDSIIQNGDQPEIVSNPSRDIAINDTCQMMQVNIPNRQKHQFIYGYTGANGRGGTTLKFDSAKDAPSDWIPQVTTHPEELNPGERRVKYLVIGLALVDADAGKYSTKGSGGKGKKRDRLTATIIERVSRMSRVLVKATEFISMTYTAYVAVHPSGGIHHIRRIPAHLVFYFSEFWPVPHPQTLTWKQAPAMFSKTVRRAAAAIKSESGNSETVISNKEGSRSTASNELEVGQAQHHTGPLNVPGDKYTLTDDGSLPSTGITAFYAAEKQFRRTECEVMLTEIKSNCEDYPDLDPKKIIRVRSQLVETGQLLQVPREYLLEFLELVHQEVHIDGDNLITEYTIRDALRVLAIFTKREARRASKLSAGVKDD